MQMPTHLSGRIGCSSDTCVTTPELRQTSSVRKLRAGTQSISCIGLLPQKLAYSQRQLLVSFADFTALIDDVRAAVPGPPRRTVMSRSESRLWRQLRRCGSVRRCTRSAQPCRARPGEGCWPTVITRGRRCSSFRCAWRGVTYGQGSGRGAESAWATHSPSEQLGDTEYRLRALWGLWISRFTAEN